MDINLNIKAPEIANAIVTLANTIASLTRVESVATLEQTTVDPTTTTLPPADNSEKQEPATTSTEPQKTPSQIRKDELSSEIIALGGTPPEKGAVKKFEEALAALKAGQDDSDGEDEIEPTPEPENTAEPSSEATSGTAPTNDDVRSLATHMLSTAENTALAKTKLGACLKKVGATSITEATPGQLVELVPLLEKNAGCTLAEALAAAVV